MGFASSNNSYYNSWNKHSGFVQNNRERAWKSTVQESRPQTIYSGMFSPYPHIIPLEYSPNMTSYYTPGNYPSLAIPQTLHYSQEYTVPVREPHILSIEQPPSIEYPKNNGNQSIEDPTIEIVTESQEVVNDQNTIENSDEINNIQNLISTDGNDNVNASATENNDAVKLTIQGLNLVQGIFYNPNNDTLKLITQFLNICVDQDVEVPTIEIQTFISKLKKLDDYTIPREALDSLESHFKDDVSENQSHTHASTVLALEEDFRNIPILPNIHELAPDYNPELKKINPQGPYESDEAYLETHFHLIREDMIRPLRSEIAKYQQTRNCKYGSIKLEEPYLDLDVNKYIHIINLEKVPQDVRNGTALKYSSLVCLSDDDFQKNFYLATIALRTDKQIGVKFVDEYDIDIQKPFVMVESPAFLEAYRHVLTALQKFRNVPFSEQFVNANFQTPAYGLLSSFSDSSLSHTGFELNEKQLEGFKHALTNEIAIIQGPPGTGKTHLGLQIINFLLLNWDGWNLTGAPIQIVCYKNHTLDMILEGILKLGITRSIVRLGERSKSDMMRNYNLKTLRRQYFAYHSIDYRDLLKNAGNLRNEIERCRDALTYLNAGIVDLDILKAHHGSSILPDNLLTWLTDPCESELRFHTVQKLVKLGVNEIKAKNCVATADSKGILLTAREIYNKLHLQPYKKLSDTRLIESAKHWPSVKDVKTVVFKGKAKNWTSSSNSCQTLVDKNTKKVNPALKSYKKYIKTAPPKEVRITKASDLWNLYLEPRWSLYQFWISKAKEVIGSKMKDLEQEYLDTQKKIEKINEIAVPEILKDSRIIGMTTTGAAKYNGTNLHLKIQKVDGQLDCHRFELNFTQAVLKEIGPAVVIVEEAAHVQEAHILASLTSSCQHLILIGDHQQLRPTPAVYELAKRYHLDLSLFERLINNNHPYAKLNCQRRMRREISEVLMPHFYEDLQDDPPAYDDVRGVTKNLTFINHSHPEDYQAESQSSKNSYEVQWASQLAKYFLQQNYSPKEITVLCTYQDQTIAIREECEKLLGSEHKLRIDNVDNFQGEESDIVILSLVKSDNSENTIGFLKTSNRICVALSRAKIGLYIVGNIDFLARKSKLWSDIKDSLKDNDAISNVFEVQCQQHNELQEITVPSDFTTKCKDGGCQQKCNYLLRCGHKCIKNCHNDLHSCEKGCKKQNLKCS